MEVPEWFFQCVLQDEVARQINKGLDLQAARSLAREIVGRAFVSREPNLQCEFEADYADYIEDMSLGGQPYRVPR